MHLFNLFIEWVKGHPYQSIGYSIILLTSSIIFTIPISYIIIMLGYTYSQVFKSKFYGFLFSVPIVYVGSELGATLSFLLSRYLFRDFIHQQIRSNQWLYQNYKLIDEIITEEGFKVVALVRLTFAPFGATSYFFGVTGISLFDYMIGNVSYIFNCCTQCYIGCSLYTAASLDAKNNESQQRLSKITFIAEIVLTVLITIFIGNVSKKILQKKMKEREQNKA